MVAYRMAFMEDNPQVRVERYVLDAMRVDERAVGEVAAMPQVEVQRCFRSPGNALIHAACATMQVAGRTTGGACSHDL